MVDRRCQGVDGCERDALAIVCPIAAEQLDEALLHVGGCRFGEGHGAYPRWVYAAAEGHVAESGGKSRCFSAARHCRKKRGAVDGCRSALLLRRKLDAVVREELLEVAIRFSRLRLRGSCCSESAHACSFPKGCWARGMAKLVTAEDSCRAVFLAACYVVGGRQGKRRRLS